MLSDELQGCSAFFPIGYTDASILSTPSCNDTIAFQSPQNIVFSWMQSPAIGAQLQYNFKIVEVIPQDRNINDAMNSATTPPFFETTTSIPLFVYGPAQPALEQGHKYAWQVTVSDANGKVYFFRDGKSEVCAFIMGNQNLFNTPVNNDFVPPTYVVNHNKEITGTLKYYFESLKPSETFPAKNLEVRLIVRYNLYDASGNNLITKNIDEFHLPTQFADANGMIASDMTDDDGNFDLQFSSIFISDFVDNNFTLDMSNSMWGGGASSATGKLKREYELWVMDGHYCQPEKYAPITLTTALQSLGTILTRVRDYSLEIDVNKIMKNGSAANSYSSGTGSSGSFMYMTNFSQLCLVAKRQKNFMFPFCAKAQGL